jgi:hypothetical protein
VQGDGQLDAAQVGGKVATGLADRIDQEFAQLRRQLRQLLAAQRTQVGGLMNGVEQRVIVVLCG